MKEIEAQYIGLFKISKKYLPNFFRLWQEYKSINTNFEKSYMTEFIQHNINKGCKITPVYIKNKWLEIDTLSDLSLDHERFWNSEL